MAFYKFLDATGAWSDPINSKYKFLKADGTWVKGNNDEKFLRADGTWNGMVLATVASDMPLGTKVKLGRLYGAPLIWLIVDKNHKGYPSNSITLLTESIVSLNEFDEKEPRNPDAHIKSQGNGTWSLSNIEQWLNSSASANNWYSAQHEYDEPPTATTSGGHNYPGYIDRAAFLNQWSSKERNTLLTTTIDVYVGYNPDVIESWQGKIFLPSIQELRYGQGAGLLFQYFPGNDASLIAKTTSNAVANGGVSSVVGYGNYWTRDKYLEDSNLVRPVQATGTKDNPSTSTTGLMAPFEQCGVRPVCNIPASTLFSLNPDSDGCYTLL